MMIRSKFIMILMMCFLMTILHAEDDDFIEFKYDDFIDQFKSRMKLLKVYFENSEKGDLEKTKGVDKLWKDIDDYKVSGFLGSKLGINWDNWRKDRKRQDNISQTIGYLAHHIVNKGKKNHGNTEAEENSKSAEKYKELKTYMDKNFKQDGYPTEGKNGKQNEENEDLQKLNKIRDKFLEAEEDFKTENENLQKKN